MNLLQQVKAARRVSVPIVAINTPDAGATIRAVCEAVNGDAPKIEWDFVRGMTPRNEAAAKAITGAQGDDQTIANPVALCEVAKKLPKGSMVFMHLANRWLTEPAVIQAVWNLRDIFKENGRMMVLLARSLTLPPEISEDVMVFDEPLPGSDELAAIVKDQHECATLKVDDATVGRSVEALRGLSAFSAEQVTAMSLRKEGIDVDNLWERKRQTIETTPGLKVFREGDRFDAIGGCSVVKGFLSRIMQGNARPNAVVFIDEIEKMLAGAGGDTSGVTQYQLGSLLSYMQDHKAAGMIFIGPPGAAKSAIAKAAGNEGGVPTIQLDLGAAKGSLVGQSEQQLRGALKTITAVSNGKSLWIATCNSIGNLPPELRRRFTLGTFFFDLPDHEERAAIWDIWTERYGVTGDKPEDAGWTGAEIRQCCDIAWRLGCSLIEASAFIVPVSRSAADSIRKLRDQADDRFLSASHPGVYRSPDTRQAPVEAAPAKRALVLE